MYLIIFCKLCAVHPVYKKMCKKLTKGHTHTHTHTFDFWGGGSYTLTIAYCVYDEARG